MEQREGNFKKLCLTLKAGLEGERGEDLDYSPPHPVPGLSSVAG